MVLCAVPAAKAQGPKCAWRTFAARCRREGDLLRPHELGTRAYQDSQQRAGSLVASRQPRRLLSFLSLQGLPTRYRSGDEAGQKSVLAPKKYFREEIKMKRLFAIAFALLFAGVGMLLPSQNASAQGAGWVTLFDGKNLDKWQGDGTANFQIADGSIVAVDKKDPKATASYLVTKDSYKDFELRAEFWVSNDANSGIFIRCTDPQKVGSKTAYEVNIFDTRPDPSYGTGAIVDTAKALKVLKAGGKWNTYHIVAKGSKLTVTLNGTKTVDGADDARFAAGPIALQFGVGVVMFRKVQIRAL
jgi:hypothetical protein